MWFLAQEIELDYFNQYEEIFYFLSAGNDWKNIYSLLHTRHEIYI
jgi:hypothetical protein